MEIRITSEDGLREAARRFMEAVAGHDLLAFYGKMGAGKTTFIKALCAELGVEDVVTSPTFALVNEYCSATTGQTIYHFDFYRVKRIEEACDMGCEDYFNSGCLCLVEWPELVEPLLPEDTVRVALEVAPDGSRILSF